jgi:putative phage-type endonuclease
MPTNLQTRPLDLAQDEFVAWLMRNQKSIGGSSIGAVCGLSTYQTPQNVWDGLVSLNVIRDENNHTTRGRIMEPHIADMYQAVTARRLVNLPSIRHPERWWFRATPDRGIISRHPTEPNNTAGILEIKSLGRETFSLSTREGIDPAYYAQIQWYMGLFGYSWGAFALHNLDSWTLHHFDVEFDQPYYQWLFDCAMNFWHNYVLTRVRPDDSTAMPPLSDVNRPETPRAGATEVRISTPEMRNALAALRDARENKNLAETAEELAADRVKELMGDVQLCAVPGVGRISYAESHRTSFDKEQLYRDYPELIGRYERRTATRVFRPTFENGSSTSHRRR